MSVFILEEEGKPTMLIAGISSYTAEKCQEEAHLKGHPTENLLPVEPGLSTELIVDIMNSCDVIVEPVIESAKDAA